MYDALNAVSANTVNSWETSEKGTRRPIFDGMIGGKNRFYYIELQNQTVNLAGVVNFTTDNSTGISFATRRGVSSHIAFKGARHIDDRPFSGAFVVDFGTLDDNIGNYLSGYNWYVDIENESGKPMTNISYKIIDNFGTTVRNAGKVTANLPDKSEKSYGINLNIQLGDVDYSGVITSDDQDLVLSYTVKNKELSSMQMVLADCNKDGVVDIMDVIAIGKLLTSNGQALSTNLDLIERLYQEYAAENGLDPSTDVTQLMRTSEAESRE